MKFFIALMITASLISCGESSSEVNESEVSIAPETNSVLVDGDCDQLKNYKNKEVYLVFGQSNGANFAEQRHDTAYSDRALTFEGDNRCKSAADPIPGANGAGGSVWVNFMDQRIKEKKAEQIIFANVSVGGTPIQFWTPGNFLYPKLIDAAARMQKANLMPTAILWVQGEANNEGATYAISSDEYYSRFIKIVESLRAWKITSPVYVALSTRCQDNGPSNAVREALKKAVRVRGAELKIFLGADTDVLGSEYRDDIHCHYNSKGQEAAADIWSKAVDKINQEKEQSKKEFQKEQDRQNY